MPDSPDTTIADRATADRSAGTVAPDMAARCPYAALEARFRRRGLLQEAHALLDWDAATLMPDGAAPGRADQLATLDLVCHEILTDPATADLLDAAEADPAGAGSDGRPLDDWQRANLREMRRAWRHATAVPADLVEAGSKAARGCEMVWRAARPASDFAQVLPSLAEVLRLTRETAAAKAAALGVTPYDALLDGFEPDGRAAWIDRLFAPLAAALPGLIDDALAAQDRRPAPLPLTGPFPLDRQEALGRRLMTAFGFDFDHGRLDVSLHPFCGGVTDDIRLTTRYDTADFASALMGVLHETGHALYEKGLPAAWRTQPVGTARGMALHESQSLLIEMQVCRGRPFFDFAAPLIRDGLGVSGPAFAADNLHAHGLRVARSLIRVDADEVTYPAHVILRYRLEQAMIAGDLAPADLPDAWGEAMAELIGVRPPDDRRGCLQDIHWYAGGWGYFPTYTLGAMAAAQLFRAACAADPAIAAGIPAGDFAPLLGWLGRHVHGRASVTDSDSLIAAATGAPLSADAYLAHLRDRYGGG